VEGGCYGKDMNWKENKKRDDKMEVPNGGSQFGLEAST
jgi:hypothetical protein